MIWYITVPVNKVKFPIGIQQPKKKKKKLGKTSFLIEDIHAILKKNKSLL